MPRKYASMNDCAMSVVMPINMGMVMLKR